MNSNKKAEILKSRDQINAEKIKFSQNKRAAEKRGLPLNNLETMKRLLDGKFHEEVADDDDDENLIEVRAMVEKVEDSRIEKEIFKYYEKLQLV